MLQNEPFRTFPINEPNESMPNLFALLIDLCHPSRMGYIYMLRVTLFSLQSPIRPISMLWPLFPLSATTCFVTHSQVNCCAIHPAFLGLCTATHSIPDSLYAAYGYLCPACDPRLRYFSFIGHHGLGLSSLLLICQHGH